MSIVSGTVGEAMADVLARAISEAQIALLYKLRTQMTERAAEKALEPVPTTPAPEGRVEVTGTVLGTKVQ